MRLLTLLLLSALSFADGNKDRDRNVIRKLQLRDCFHSPEEQRQNPPPRKPTGVCLQVNATSVYFKDRHGATHVLTLPKEEISGIEDSRSFSGDENYFADAWRSAREQGQAQPNPLAARNLPRDRIALGINSVRSRTQDQLHIHADCAAPGVGEELREQARRLLRTPGGELALRSSGVPIRLQSADAYSARRNRENNWGPSYPQQYIVFLTRGEHLRVNPLQMLESVRRTYGGARGDYAVNVVGTSSPFVGFFILFVKAHQDDQNGADAEVVVARSCDS